MQLYIYCKIMEVYAQEIKLVCYKNTLYCKEICNSETIKIFCSTSNDIHRKIYVCINLKNGMVYTIIQDKNYQVTDCNWLPDSEHGEFVVYVVEQSTN